ncbi:MAG: hypothetical protein AB7S36_17370 [Planctomycetota bacterium]
MAWIDTRNADEARRLVERIWGIVSLETDTGWIASVRGDGLYEGDEFWADAIRKLKDKPQERLAMALRHLPLPAAFREAAVALRALIRAKQKEE